MRQLWVLDKNYVNPIGESIYNDLTVSSSLSDLQDNSLKNTLAKINSNPTHKNFINELRASGTKLKYQINSNLNTPGSFNPFTNTIQFRSASDINYNTVLEEFFHAYQHYKVGIGKYMTSPFKGRSNIEFEAKLYHDITCLVSSPASGCTFLGGISNEYSNWLMEITEDWTRYPS